MITQTDFFNPAATTIADGITTADQADLRAQIMSRDWQTREQIANALGWPVRKVRAVAQSLGGQIIRCQAGYKLTAACTRDDAPQMMQAADAAGSQARIGLAYEIAVRRALHSLIG
jgi:hypothetical protein